MGRVGNDNFSEEADRRNYQLGLSQVLTRNSLLGIDLEVVSDEGFLQNPYRQNRYRDPNDSTSFLYQPERYPETRTSTSVATRALYYLPYRAQFAASTAISRTAGVSMPIPLNWPMCMP
ncbi:DUF3570 domain-containing protein [Marinobacter similis]|uniref:DUF3570 domain-containing protein n=1 Tax=Marinobacter similis TaxID=1420916 RepID=UPI002E820A9C|nr:DUF3570 domain-containing protein [Marinobacter similis]